MAGTHLLKRIPRIKFPDRHPKLSGSVSQQLTSPSGQNRESNMSKLEVPDAPKNIAFGGKASLQPKRTPVSDHEIEAILELNVPYAEPFSPCLHPH